MDKDNYPRISIIVACLNAGEKIAKTIRSIIDQPYSNKEIIIVDGDSKDNTLTIINAFAKEVQIIISEKDSGIGDAWNKGLSRCTGQIIGILNAGDFYADNIFDDISKAFTNLADPYIGYGDTTLFNHNGKMIKKIGRYSKSNFSLLNGFEFMHPSVFFTPSVTDKIGYFDIKKRIAVDTDWLLRARARDIPFIRIPSHTYMETGGLSEIFQYTAMGEYLDSLVTYGIPRYYLSLFFIFRFLGSLWGYFRHRH